LIFLCYNFANLNLGIQVNKESYLINKLSSRSIGDDGAIIGNMIYSMDAFFEDVHFKREWMSIKQIAYKAMMVNLSDAVAMNAKPLYALTSLALPKDINHSQIDELIESLEETAKAYDCEIIGGDTIASDKLHLSITIVSKSDNPLRRVGLKSGHLLAFTGYIGESKKDLERLFRGETIDENSKFYRPILRSEFIYKVREFLEVGMDISDGLFCDTNKLLDINNMGFEILQPISADEGLSGEEYEMLIGFDEQNIEKIKQIAKETNTQVTIFAKASKNSHRYECEEHHF
jgi:thiamine-monophosphate kinase